jgi:hypothetical protein
MKFSRFLAVTATFGFGVGLLWLTHCGASFSHIGNGQNGGAGPTAGAPGVDAGCVQGQASCKADNDCWASAPACSVSNSGKCSFGKCVFQPQLDLTTGCPCMEHETGDCPLNGSVGHGICGKKMAATATSAATTMWCACN